MTTLIAGRIAGAELPPRMRRLARDRRGYPIPYIVLIDAGGTPQFTINDIRRIAEVVTRRLCSICGARLARDRFGRREYWFVGGSRCFLHPAGAFLDPPVHRECGEYALRVCPFLAASRYVRRIDAAKLDPAHIPLGMTLATEAFMQPRLPERFGFGMAWKYGLGPDPSHLRFLVPDWRYVEFWRAGEPVGAPDHPVPADAGVEPISAAFSVFANYPNNLVMPPSHRRDAALAKRGAS